MRIRRGPRLVSTDMRFFVRFLPLVPFALVALVLTGCGSKY